MKEKKRELRTIVADKLTKLSPEEVREKSGRIAELIFTLPAYKEAKILLGYMSMPGEADVSPILRHAFESGKEVAVPRMKGERFMDFHLIESVDGPWDHHEYGIREPRSHLPKIFPAECPSETVLILVPGLAFDRHGNRLGRGKGFYDTYLSLECENIRAIGIAFSCQIVDTVPVSDHDRSISGVVTEKEIILP